MAKTISDLSDITDFVINKGNGVKGLSELGLKSIPNQYIQPLEERISTMIMSQDSIPIIDMSNWNDPEVVESICSAAEKLGFFQLVNHGVPVEVLENVKEATHRFFLLSAEEKSKYSKEHSPSNNVQYGTSFIPQAEKALEWKDFLGLYAYEDDDEASAFWPPVCRDEVLEYMKKSEILAKRLVELLMRRLNVKEIDEAKEYLLMGAKRIQLNYYPICPNPELAVGNGRHSDISTLTILLQDDIGGLYVRRNDNDNGNDKDSGWIHVPPVKGSLVINIGDALQIISNGRYKSVEHRVAVSSSKNRVSIPIFVFPRPSEMISPLPEVLESGEEPVYKSVLFSDYVKHFFAKPHNGKTTIEFAKI